MNKSLGYIWLYRGKPWVIYGYIGAKIPTQFYEDDVCKSLFRDPRRKDPFVCPFRIQDFPENHSYDVGMDFFDHQSYEKSGGQLDSWG